ncbi:MAG: glycerol-3-phosphate dehydrogenase/oxidase [Actinomycetales bacterium]|nr:glycerol-3-phosphate dehydrogenase/oxidase [Actinomycetales bacterium]
MSSFTRADAMRAMASTRYDVVVIGAGMTGAGAALDAASRGLRVALIDGGDIGSGTSSKSSKMVHGGLRYLQQKEFRLVRENLRERQRLLENAPYLVRPLPFLIPLFGANGVAATALVKGYATALRFYDWAGGWRIGHRYRRINRDEAMAFLPTLRADRLVAGFLYYDARGDDARVALLAARTAALDYGADVANYVRAIALAHGADGRVRCVTARDERTGDTVDIATRCVINATGVWADQVIAMAEGSSSTIITPAKGVHISVPADRLPATVAAVFAVPEDRRSIFVVPFEDAPYTFVGTTDTAYDGDLDDPLCDPDDVAYLLKAVNASTDSNLTTDDVTGVWAGLRPLLAPAAGQTLSQRTADLSRRHRVIDSGDAVVHVTGGKWTTYRQMAQDAVNAAGRYVGRSPVRTKHLRYHGTGPWRPTTDLETHLYRRYGQDALVILTMIKQDPTLGDAPIASQPYVLGEFRYSVQFEMAQSLVDLLTRRTRAHLHDARATLAAAPRIARVVATDFAWGDDEIERQLAEYADLVERELRAAGLSLDLT